MGCFFHGAAISLSQSQVTRPDSKIPVLGLHHHYWPNLPTLVVRLLAPQATLPGFGLRWSCLSSAGFGFVCSGSRSYLRVSRRGFVMIFIYSVNKLSHHYALGACRRSSGEADIRQRLQTTPLPPLLLWSNIFAADCVLEVTCPLSISTPVMFNGS